VDSNAEVPSNRGSSPTQDVNRQNYQREHQQNMDETSQGVGTNQSHSPQNQQCHEYGPKHVKLLSLLSENQLSGCRAVTAHHRTQITVGPGFLPSGESGKSET
jgi:hypothetical protein